MIKSRKIGLCVLAALACTAAFAAAGCSKEAHTHTYSEAWAFDASSHWHPATCSHDTKTALSAHSFEEVEIAATAERGGYTLHVCACGYSYTTDPSDPTGPDAPASDLYLYDEEVHRKLGDEEAVPHAYTDEEVPATCTAAGYIKHTCVCGYWYASDPTPLAKHTANENVWEHSDGAHWHPCLVCGGRADTASAHEFAENVVPPTCEEEGYTEFVCACGYSYRGMQTEPRHTFSETFESDEYEHWRESTCEHKDEDGEPFRTDVGEHALVGGSNVCTVCHKTVQPRLAFALSADGSYYIVTGIGCLQTKDVEIPETYRERIVREIAAGAFENAEIDSVSGGKNLQKIGSNAFAGSALQTVRLTASEVGMSAFEGCEKLSSVTLSGTVRIGARAFADCTALTALTLPEELVHVEAGAFEGSGLIEEEGNAAYAANVLIKADGAEGQLTVREGTVGIADEALRGNTALTSVTLADGVRFVGMNAFRGCEKLTTVDFKGSLRLIGANSFRASGLIQAILPETMETIEQGAFASCTKLTSAELGGTTAIAAYVFQNCTLLETVTAGEGALLEVGAQAFEGTKLSSLDLSKCERVGFAAFADCTSFDPTDLSALVSAEEYAFSNCAIEEADLPLLKSVANELFSGCTKLQTVKLTASEVGMSAFEGCEKLSSVTLDGTMRIGARAFFGCTALTALTLPETVDRVEEDAFTDSGLIKTESGATYAANIFVRAASAAQVTVKTGTVGIADGALRGNTALTSVTLADSVRFVGVNAFRGCEKLSSIDLKSVTLIGANSFRESGLKSITVPVTVKTVGDNAFYDCKELTSATIGAEMIGKFAFSYTGVGRDLTHPVKQRPSYAKLANITLLEGVKIVGSNAFQYCPVSAAALPATLEEIGGYAFAQTDLAAVTIPAAVVRIGGYAFYGSRLTSAVFEKQENWKAGSRTLVFGTPAVNARYLADTYCDIDWVRG